MVALLNGLIKFLYFLISFLLTCIGMQTAMSISTMQSRASTFSRGVICVERGLPAVARAGCCVRPTNTAVHKLGLLAGDASTNCSFNCFSKATMQAWTACSAVLCRLLLILAALYAN